VHGIILTSRIIAAADCCTSRAKFIIGDSLTTSEVATTARRIVEGITAAAGICISASPCSA
jgi:hypothetical protein